MDLRAIPDNERLLNLYRAYLTMQCGLADNTSLAYTEDVRKLLSYLDDESVPLADAGYPALENFLATLNDLGISPKSGQCSVRCGCGATRGGRGANGSQSALRQGDASE